MQPTKTNDIASTYGPLGLSALAIIVVALAAFSHGINWTLAIDTIGAILAGNGLLGAARWQAAPGLMADIQLVLQQLLAHIQELHSQQTPATITKIVPTPIALPADASPVPPRASAEPTQASA